MSLSFRTSLLSLGISALSITSAKAQTDCWNDKPTKRTIGVMSSLASYHTAHDQYYNPINPGLGICYPMNFKFLERWNATMDTEVGAYYNSIRSYTPFLAVTFNKKLGRSGLSVGLAAGLFGYQDLAKDKITYESHAMATDASVPASIDDGPVRTFAWRSALNEYTEKVTDKRARAEGQMHFYPMPIPRICYDVIDNEKMTLGFAAQGGWLPNKGGVIGLSMYVFGKN